MNKLTYFLDAIIGMFTLAPV